MPDFLILGLPRSRTAWLANFMTTDGLFCYHEAIDGCNSMSEYAEKVKGKGDSDTALALFDYQEHFPLVPTVIIDSSISKSVKFGLDNGYDITETMIEEKLRLDEIEGLHVNVNDINKRLPEIWAHLTDLPYNIGRANMLKKLNIQVNDVRQFNINSMKRFIENTNGCLTRKA